MDILDKSQREIVASNEPKILVVAASGSGKTRVLTERVKRLINDGVPTKGIVAITFTNAAADEMKERLGDIVGEAYIGTIHGYANKILLMNGVDTTKYIEEENFDKFFHIIKNREIKLPVVDHLLVDEFQDVDKLEFEFFQLIKPKNFMAVGDDFQCIYEWRGSDLSIFMDLAKDSKTKIYVMNTNYRSGAEIVEFAENFIEPVRNKIEKRIYCKNPCGEVVIMKNLNVDYIVDMILEEENYGDWFILTRSNAQLENIYDEFVDREIPCDTFKKSELDSDELRKKMKENTVKILTVHSAKGLENKNVVVLGVRPFWDEERRVAYVAATRAKDLLVWVRSLNEKKATPKKIMNWE